MRGCGKLQHDLAALPSIDRPEQAGVAAIRQNLAKPEFIYDLATRRQVQDRKRRDRMGELVTVRGRQVDDVDHERGGVVAAAGGERRIDNRARGLFRRCTLAQ